MTNLPSGQPLDNGERREAQAGIRLLLDTYEALYGPEITISHLDDLAGDLSQIAGRSRPWTGKYLHSLIKGYDGFSANHELIRALTILGCCLDSTGEVQAKVRPARDLVAVNDLPAGTVILGRAQRCANCVCPVIFVATHPRQKYHSRACREMARRLRRREMPGESK